jgi:hypothetical protein
MDTKALLEKLIGLASRNGCLDLLQDCLKTAMEPKSALSVSPSCFPISVGDFLHRPSVTLPNVFDFGKPSISSGRFHLVAHSLSLAATF